MGGERDGRGGEGEREEGGKIEGKEERERERAGRAKEAGTHHHRFRLSLQHKSVLAGCPLFHQRHRHLQLLLTLGLKVPLMSPPRRLSFTARCRASA